MRAPLVFVPFRAFLWKPPNTSSFEIQYSLFDILLFHPRCTIRSTCVVQRGSIRRIPHRSQAGVADSMPTVGTNQNSARVRSVHKRNGVPPGTPLASISGFFILFTPPTAHWNPICGFSAATPLGDIAARPTLHDGRHSACLHGG